MGKLTYLQNTKVQSPSQRPNIHPNRQPGSPRQPVRHHTPHLLLQHPLDRHHDPIIPMLLQRLHPPGAVDRRPPPLLRANRSRRMPPGLLARRRLRRRLTQVRVKTSSNFHLLPKGKKKDLKERSNADVRQLRPRRPHSNASGRNTRDAYIRAINRVRHGRAIGQVRATGSDPRRSAVSELGGEDGGTENVDYRRFGGWERVGVCEGSELVYSV